jgi:pimeloyl-ACP methyl ester carboxylesterase
VQKLKKIALIILLVYLVLGLILYLFQDMLLFHPKPLRKEHSFSFDQPFEELNIASGSDNISILKFPTAEEKRGIALFFHGNMENVEHYRDYPFLFTRNGYEVWIIDYPGFGKSTGKRSEAILEKEALDLYDMARKEISPDSILVYGKSIGTGIAAYLASKRPCRELILETPYYSIGALVGHYFPIYPSFLTRYSFPTFKYLNRITAPVSIIHGTDDEVVPYSQGKQLAREHKSVGLVTIQKGKHNNLVDFPEFQEAIDSLMAN